VARNVTVQVLRGVQANIQSAMPLSLGEMYFATDTGVLYFGTPGVGLGYVQIGDMSQISDLLTQQNLILEGMRRAMVAIACEGKRNDERDFDPLFIALDDSINTISTAQ